MEFIDKYAGPALLVFCLALTLTCAVCITVLLVRVAFGKRRK